ncbi:MAG: hypothetical protein K8R85_09550 [Bacteroidetes bacterium]|nr:hypothetical protein [Bacteroidota bacterium]
MKILLTILYSCFTLISFAQVDSIAYSRDYEFTEGVFLTIDQFKNNDPIPKASIISGIPKSQLDFLKQLIEQKNIFFTDSKGVQQKIETASVWGYCQNRSVYINFNKQFNKLNVIGTLCHFTAMVATSVGFHDPMGYGGVNNTVNELRQYVFDTQTNKVFDFTVKNMETLLQSDSALYNQFMALKKREKPDAIFVYLRKFNEKHPLFILNR